VSLSAVERSVQNEGIDETVSFRAFNVSVVPSREVEPSDDVNELPANICYGFADRLPRLAVRRPRDILLALD